MSRSQSSRRAFALAAATTLSALIVAEAPAAAQQPQPPPAGSMQPLPPPSQPTGQPPPAGAQQPPPAAQPGAAQPGAAQPGAPAAPRAQPPPGYGQPPPGYGQPPPGYGQPPPGYGQPPPGYPYYYPPPGYYGGQQWPTPPPIVPKQRKSTGLMVTGILLTSVGAVGLVAGGVLYASADGRTDVYCDDGTGVYLCDRRDDEGRQVGGGVLMVISGLVLVAGIPLWIYGGQKVPVVKEGEPTQPGPGGPGAPGVPTALLPKVFVGPTGGSLRWAF
jgi:hypothetical protein